MVFRNSPAGYFIAAAACVGMVAYALATGEFPVKGGEAILRATRPQAFWVGVAIFGAGAVGSFWWAVRLMGRDAGE
jgi:hypothetical protein